MLMRISRCQKLLSRRCGIWGRSLSIKVCLVVPVFEIHSVTIVQVKRTARHTGQSRNTFLQVKGAVPLTNQPRDAAPRFRDTSAQTLTRQDWNMQGGRKITSVLNAGALGTGPVMAKQKKDEYYS